MKTEFKAKFLQHVAKKRKEEGFTLIELLVVIIIIGILSAIALPSFLNQANKAKQSEGKQYISSLNKGQQAYYAENSKFTADSDDLGLGIKTATGNYTYSINTATINNDSAAKAHTGNAASGLRGYAGAVFLVDVGEAKTSKTTFCESSGATSTTYTFNDASTCDGAGSWAEANK